MSGERTQIKAKDYHAAIRKIKNLRKHLNSVGMYSAASCLHAAIEHGQVEFHTWGERESFEQIARRNGVQGG